jgi:septal ring factor EnvC (AmiA/AmiB activator)
MTPAETLVYYAAENKAIIYVLVILLIVAIAVAAFFGLLYAIQKVQIRSWKKHQTSLETEVQKRGQEIRRLKDQCGDVDFIKAEMRRYDAIRDKTEKRMKEQNALVQSLEDQLTFYKIMVEHIDLPVLKDESEGKKR